MTPLIRSLIFSAPAGLPSVVVSALYGKLPEWWILLIVAVSFTVSFTVNYELNTFFQNRRDKSRKEGELYREWVRMSTQIIRSGGALSEYSTDYVERHMIDKQYIPLNYFCPLCDRKYSWKTERCKNKACKKMKVAEIPTFTNFINGQGELERE